MASVRLENIRKTYPSGIEVLPGLDLSIEEGERMVLVGPSGSGKSTALKIVAGLESPSAGRVYIGGRDVTQSEPGARDVAMVFQSYALYPHMTVRENLAFGMRMRNVPKKERTRRAQEMAERLAIAELLERKPAQLSGGQRQRVALGRALVRQPQVFLLDEPLSNLDAKLRAEMRAELARLHATLGVTTMYVTHDQEEAMTLGNRIAVMGKDGRLEQLAPPLDVYRHPCNVFVAEFIGLPRINWFEGAIEDREFRSPDLRAHLGVNSIAARNRVRAGIRPHDLLLVESAHAPLHGCAELVENLGANLLVHARSTSGLSFRILVAADNPLRRGDHFGVAPNPDRILLFDADLGTLLSPAGGRAQPFSCL